VSQVVRAFPDGQSALNLAAAKRYLNIELLKDRTRPVKATG